MKRIIISAVAAMFTFSAHAESFDSVLTQLGFVRTNRGVNETVHSVYVKTQDFNKCNRLIQVLAQLSNQTPTNIIETSSVRAVRFKTDATENMIMTCNGPESKTFVSFSHDRG